MNYILDTKTRDESTANAFKPVLRLSLYILLSFDLLISSRFYFMLGASYRTLCFGVIVGIVFSNFFAALALRLVKQCALFVFMISFLLIQHLVFSVNFDMPLNVNSLAQYYPATTFICYSVAIDIGDEKDCPALMGKWAVAYAVGFIIISALVQLDWLSPDLTKDLTQSDVERGARVLIIPSLIIFAIFYSWSAFAARKKMAQLVGLLITLSALALSQSRFLILSFLIGAIFPLLVDRRSNVISFFSFAVFCVTSLAMLYGVLDQWWNPFDYFAGDSSGHIRMFSYRTALEVIEDYPITGGGIAGSDTDLTRAVSNYTFSPMDLGVLGVWFVFGALGVVLYFYSTLLTCWPVRPRNTLQRGNIDPLQMTGCVLALSGCLTPAIWFNNTYFGLVLALYLAKKPSQIKDESLFPSRIMHV